MPELVTVTVNPTIDVSFEVDEVLPTHKIRGRDERHDPGGGGINVARVFSQLGGSVRCFYMAGGTTGATLDNLVDRHGLDRVRIPIEGETRIAMAVLEKVSGKQFRLVADGPEVSEANWRALLQAVVDTQFEYIVASGSLTKGVPDDFFARLAEIARQRGKRMVLDSSGRGLAGGLAGGGIFLAKPSRSELSHYLATPIETEAEIAEAASALVAAGACENIAVSLGSDGAMLVNESGVLRLPAVMVEAVSAVGSGDSFVAGMVHHLMRGHPIEDAFRFGLASGAAAVMTPGTDLARPEDIQRLYESAARG